MYNDFAICAFFWIHAMRFIWYEFIGGLEILGLFFFL